MMNAQNLRTGNRGKEHVKTSRDRKKLGIPVMMGHHVQCGRDYGNLESMIRR